MTEAQKGILALLAACTVWGLSPLYYKALADVPALEVLSHRTLWSLLIFGALMAAQGQLGALAPLFRRPQIWRVLVAALMISLNWYSYIHAIQTGHGVEASLGYYVFPLVAVLLGMIAFGERLSKGQGVAVGLAALAVGCLTYGLGVTPWLSLALAVTFGVYAMVKRQIAGPAMATVTAEVLLLAPLALLWLAHLPQGGHFNGSVPTAALLAFTGIITAVPLMLFSYAARRVSMATFGLTQYLNPTLQFLCATMIFAEPFSRWHLLAFALIWLALAVYSLDTWRADRLRRASARADTSGSTLT